jgi:hypothetical protein
MLWRALMVATGLCLACGQPSESGTARTLAALPDFVFTAAEEDPWAQHRPSEVQCSGLTGWYVEEDVLEVDTARCNYFSGTAPARVSAAAGDRLRAQVVHFDLVAPQPGVAHLALVVGGRPVWEREVPIPGAGDVIPVEVELSEAVSPGAAVTWHLHNHGQNHWRLSAVDLRGR